MFLTREPGEVCALLGMDREMLGIDEEGYIWSGDEREGSGFRSMEEMYEMVVRLRFFRRESYAKGTLKANDRKRMAQRDGYSKFVDKWLPAYEGPEGGDLTLTREGLADEVFEKFDVRGKYEKRIEEWRMEREALNVKREERGERKMKALESRTGR